VGARSLEVPGDCAKAFVHVQYFEAGYALAHNIRTYLDMFLQADACSMLKACCARYWQQLSSKQQAAAGSRAAILQAGEPSQRQGAYTWAGELLLGICIGWA
jgi:hypothetical protein